MAERGSWHKGKIEMQLSNCRDATRRSLSCISTFALLAHGFIEVENCCMKVSQTV
ncbi:unknown [Porphyromonas sp. CAG:1061]|nr:unknown [Porphyromonas sp. CAG:1061]